MSGPRILAFDCGGTRLKAALVDPENWSCDEPCSVESPEQADVAGFARALAALGRKVAGDAPLAGIGIAIPGPFDFERGVSRMQHKFPKLHGCELLPALAGAFGEDRIAFLNDAQAFAIGAWRMGGASVERFVAITLGTGLGVGFLLNGAPQAERELWDLPYGDSILEARVSRARIRLDYAADAVVDAPDLNRKLDALGVPDVAEIAERADRGEVPALAAFAAFGRHLGRGLCLGVLPFSPQLMMLGGQIARAGRHFMAALRSELGASADRVRCADEITIAKAAFVGTAAWVLVRPVSTPGHR